MHSLEKITKLAKQTANRELRLMTIWNLNRYSPMYVVRLARDDDAEKYGYVATVQPEEPNDDDLDAIA